jgi:hypothetical protein
MDFPIVRKKKKGTTAGTRVLCTQYLLRVATFALGTTHDNNDFTAKNTDTHLFPPKCLKNQKSSIFILIKKVLLINKKPAP